MPICDGSESKVGQLDVPVVVEQHVVRLEITVAVAQLVHRLDGARELRRVRIQAVGGVERRGARAGGGCCIWAVN